MMAPETNRDLAPDGIGTLLRAHRTQSGLTREAVARLMEQAQDGRHFDPENFKRWESETRLPVPRWHPLMERALGIPLADITRAWAASKAWRHRHETATGGEDGTAVKRRTFLAGTAAAGATALPGVADAREGIDAALSGSSSADIAYLQAVFERDTGGYRGRDPEHVLQRMNQDLALLRDVLARPHPARDRTELVRTAAGLAGLVAIIQHDRGDQRDAHRWFSTAEHAAAESGDRIMHAWVLARHAMVGLNYGSPRTAAELAARAQHAAGARPSAASALAAAISARALAATGDGPGALNAVTRTCELAERLGSADLADTWFGYPHQKHHVHLSQAYTLLGDTTNAYAEQDAALALTHSPSVMTRALLALDTAHCLRTDGDPQAAADMATGVWERLPTGYRTGLVRTRAETLRDTHRGTPRASR